mgnify:CR=1 FL=1
MFRKKKKNEYEEVVEEGRDEFIMTMKISRQTLYLWTKMKMRNQREAALARR